MKLDNEHQRSFLLQVLEQAQISGNYKQAIETAQFIIKLINDIKIATLESVPASSQVRTPVLEDKK